MLACNHAPTTAAPSSAPAAAVPAPAPNPFEVTLDWKPEETSAPAGFWLRLKSPNTVVPRVVKLTADPRLRGFEDLRPLAAIVLGGELSALIDLDAPLSMVLARKGSDNFAVVAAAHPTNEAQFVPAKLGDKLRPLGLGRWEIRPSDGGEKLRCELWHAAAPVGYRILCGVRREDIAPHAPFLLGQLEKRPPTADATVGAAHFPLNESSAKHEREAKPGAKPDTNGESEFFDRWARAAMNAQSVAFDLDFLQQDIELAIAFDYAESDVSPGVRSWLGKAPEPLPRQFWQTLDLSPVAIANAGTDETTMKELLSDPAVAGLLTSFNRNCGISPEVSERMLNAMGGFIPERLRFTMAMGGTLSSSARERSATPSKNGKTAANGWLLLGYAGSGESYLKGLAVLEEASKAKATIASSKRAPTTRWTRVTKVPSDLPTESVVVRQDCADKSTSFAWVLPASDWIWMVSAQSEAQMLAQARRVLPTLREAPAASNDTEQAAAAGHEPPLMEMRLSLAALKETSNSSMQDLELSTLPFGGSSRVAVSVTGRTKLVAGKPLVSVRVTSRWSPAAAADLVELVKQAKSESDKTKSEGREAPGTQLW
jgi:hypothetical protein